ncbi:MAG TPA: hypothetical protein VF139_18825 [Candidatus Polarisedimenticolaceae bacterium]
MVVELKDTERDIVEKLEREGWEVRWKLGWVAEARKGSYHERAVADSREEALRELSDLTLLDAVEGCP